MTSVSVPTQNRRFDGMRENAPGSDTEGIMRASSPRALRIVRSGVTLLTALAVVLPVSFAPVLAQETAEIAGTILDPDGRPANGFRIVLKDLVGGNEFTSAPSAADGSYAISLPVGGKYALAALLAPDGTPLPVQTIPPISLDQAGSRRLDVAFQRQGPPGNVPDEDRDDRSGVPWYRKGWGIAVMVVGAGAVAALALGGGGDGPASPSNP